ncbi:MAG: hypothetical protein JW918_07160 [Anaerolineae bacterium]|nr:hypothetical protein [Anaerolineae bacterium]
MEKQARRESAPIIILLCCLVTALSICCQPQARVTYTPMGLLKDEVEFEVLVNDDLGDSPVTGGLMRNNSDKLYSFHTQILYYDSRGKLLGTHPSIVLDLYPGVEQAFFITPLEDWSRAARVEVDVVNIVKAEPTPIRPRFEFGNFSVYHHEYGTRVFGEATNRDEERQYTINVLGAVLDAQGEIKKANVHMIRNLHPGETRMFAVDVVGEDTDATDGRVYLESITEVTEPQERANITFSNVRMVYNSELGRTGAQFDIVNHGERAYHNILLVFGVYDAGRLVHVDWASVSQIGPQETIPFDRLMFDGNFAGYELKIAIDTIEARD